MLVAALAGIAVAAALVAVAWKWGGNEPDQIANLGTTEAQQSAPAGGAGARCVPPRSGTATFPESADDCVDNGWEQYAQFTDESECLDHVASITP